MYPTFTGSSRKARNVNLSGQRSSNPFTSTSWGPTAAAQGASQTVAHAQAERQQRQQERDRLKAASRIQRTWRGYQVRRDQRAAWRRLFDRIYDEPGHDPGSRSVRAVPLILAAFEASRPDDRHRLVRAAQDLLQSDFSAYASKALDPAGLSRLGHVLIVCLQRRVTSIPILRSWFGHRWLIRHTLLQAGTQRGPSASRASSQRHTGSLASKSRRAGVRAPGPIQGVGKILPAALLQRSIAQSNPGGRGGTSDSAQRAWYVTEAPSLGTLGSRAVSLLTLPCKHPSPEAHITSLRFHF